MGSQTKDRVLERGLTVMVVEDEALIAMDMQEMLQKHGCRVLGPAATVQDALELLDRVQPQVAILDVNLGGERIDPVAEALRRRGVPFLVSSAYEPAAIRRSAPLRNAACLAKPISERRLLAGLAELLWKRRRAEGHHC